MPDATAPTARGDAHDPVTALHAWPDRDASGGDPALSTALYRGIVRWTSWLVRGYYRVDVRGAEFAESRRRCWCRTPTAWSTPTC